MIEPISPYLLTNRNCPAYWLIDNLWMPLAGSHLTGNDFTLMEQVCGTGIGGPQTHMHPMDEGMYILEGHATFQVGGERVEAGPEMFLSIPRYTEHSFTIDQPDTRVLNFYTPGGFENFITNLAIPAAERKAPKPGSTPMPPRWMAEETSREFGQIPAQDFFGRDSGLALPLADPPNEENSRTKPSAVNPSRPYGIHIEQASSYWYAGALWTVLAAGEQNGGAYSLLECRYASGGGPELHSHRQAEAWYVREGQLTVVAAAQRWTAEAGAFIYIPAQCTHAFRVESSEARLLNWFLPGGPERLIMDFGTPASARTPPPAGTKMLGTDDQHQALRERLGITRIEVI